MVREGSTLHQIGLAALMMGGLWVFLSFGAYCLLTGDLGALIIGLFLSPLLLVWWPLAMGNGLIFLMIVFGLVVLIVTRKETETPAR